MKKQKINLKELKVQSFVTSLSEENQQTVKGGGDPQLFTAMPCKTAPQMCPPND